MFDKEFDQRSYTNIHVEQQPNDAADAARLYGQIKDKVESEWLYLQDLPDNGIKGKIYTAHDILAMGTRVRIAFAVNGKDYTVDTVIHDEWLAKGFTEPTIQTLHRLIADVVVHELLGSVTDGINQIFKRR